MALEWLTVAAWTAAGTQAARFALNIRESVIKQSNSCGNLTELPSNICAASQEGLNPSLEGPLKKRGKAEIHTCVAWCKGELQTRCSQFRQ